MRIEVNSGSERMVRHLPVPCLRTPALRAVSSCDVHFCFGAPILPEHTTTIKTRTWNVSLLLVSVSKWHKKGWFINWDVEENRWEDEKQIRTKFFNRSSDSDIQQRLHGDPNYESKIVAETTKKTMRGRDFWPLFSIQRMNSLFFFGDWTPLLSPFYRFVLHF